MNISDTSTDTDSLHTTQLHSNVANSVDGFLWEEIKFFSIKIINLDQTAVSIRSEYYK